MDCTICAFETSRRAGASSRVGGPVRFRAGCDSGRSFLRVSVEADVFLHYKNLWPGASPGPPNDIRAAQGGRPAWSVPGSASGAGTAWLPPATSASRPCAAMPNSPAARLVGERVLRRLKAALDTLPGPRLRGPSVECSSRRCCGGDLRGSGGGTAPRQPPQGTHGVWPRGVCWLPLIRGVRQARPPQPRTLRGRPFSLCREARSAGLHGGLETAVLVKDAPRQVIRRFGAPSWRPRWLSTTTA